MNPLRWRREEQIAWLIVALLGAMAGLFFAWMQSSFRSLASGDMAADRDHAAIIWEWLKTGWYWPWPTFGVLVTGLLFYLRQLLRS